MRNTDFTKILDKTIGKRVASFRKAKNISRVNLAADLGISTQQLDKYENGQNRISMSKMVLIAKALGESIDRICGYHKPNSTIDLNILVEITENLEKLEPQLQKILVDLSRIMATRKLQDRV